MPLTAINPHSLWDVTELTDLTAGTLLIYTPVAESGELDPLRTFRFKGRTFLGGLPFEFDVPAANVPEALAAWLPALEEAMRAAKDAQLTARLLQPGRVPERPS